MKARLGMILLASLILGSIGFAGPRLAAATDNDPAIVCTHEDPCGPGYVCRGGRCIPKK